MAVPSPRISGPRLAPEGAADGDFRASPCGRRRGALPPCRQPQSPSGDVHADLRLVNEIFIAYRSALRTGNPVGENSEITAALAGRNRLGYAFIPADSPAINAKGELCDRWGTPYFFHQLSGERMEIRSAGPDRRLWTATTRC